MPEKGQNRRSGGRRPRRSREQVSRALVEAAAALLAERPSGHVTVRDIAARADVNPTFVHRYFGSKRELMQEAMLQAQLDMTHAVEEMPDVIEGAAGVLRATLAEKEFIAAVARAILDGAGDVIPRGNPAMARLVERFEEEVQVGGIRGRYEARMVVACLACAGMGYALFGPFVRRGVGIEAPDDKEVEADLVALLQDVARLAFGE